MEDVKDREDDELVRLENSLMSGIPCDNAYFMSVYTTCMEIIEDRVINTELKKRILRPAVKAIERALVGGMFRIDLVAITLLKDVPNLLNHPKLKKLATQQNIVLNSLELCEGKSFMQPRTYMNYLCKVAREGYKDLLLAELFSLQEEARTAGYTEQLALAYIDIQIDANRLEFSGVEWEERNNFAKLVGKFEL